MVSTHIHQHTDGTSISNCTEMGIQINPSKLKQSCQILSKSKSKPHTFSKRLSNRYRSGVGVWGWECPYCILTKIWYTSFWSCRHIVALYWKLLQIYFTEKKKLGEWTTLWFLPPSQGINGCFGFKTASYTSRRKTAHRTDNFVLWPLSQDIYGCFVHKLEKQLTELTTLCFVPLSLGIHGCLVHILQGEKQLTEWTTLCFVPLSQGIHGCFVHILQGRKQLTELTTLCFDLFLRVINQPQQRATANAHLWPRECCARTYQGGVQLRLHQLHEEVPPDLQKLLAVPRLGHRGHCFRGRVERMVPGLDRANKMNYLDFLTKPAQRTFNKHLSLLKVFRTYRLHFRLIGAGSWVSSKYLCPSISAYEEHTSFSQLFHRNGQHSFAVDDNSKNQNQRAGKSRFGSYTHTHTYMHACTRIRTHGQIQFNPTVLQKLNLK